MYLAQSGLSLDGDMDPKTVGVFRWTIGQARQHLGGVLVGGVGLPVSAGVVGAFVRLPRNPSTWDRVLQGGLVAVITFGIVVVSALLFAWLRAPYQQRNALRVEIANHMAQEHPPGQVIVDFKQPSSALRWVPAKGEVYTLIEIPVGLILNETPYGMSLQFFLDGVIDGKVFKSDIDLWTRVAAKYPQKVAEYLGNPVRAQPTEDFRGVIPFLAPRDEGLFGKHMDAARILVIDLLTEKGQWIAEPGAEFRWSHPGFGGWDNDLDSFPSGA